MIDGLLRMRRRRDDEPLVVLEHLEPVTDVGRMVLARLEGETQVRAKEGGSEFGDQFFARVAWIAEALSAEVPIEAGRVRVLIEPV